jgi:hypothetical protein
MLLLLLLLLAMCVCVCAAHDQLLSCVWCCPLAQLRGGRTRCQQRAPQRRSRRARCPSFRCQVPGPDSSLTRQHVLHWAEEAGCVW